MCASRLVLYLFVTFCCLHCLWLLQHLHRWRNYPISMKWIRNLILYTSRWCGNLNSVVFERLKSLNFIPHKCSNRFCRCEFYQTKIFWKIDYIGLDRLAIALYKQLQYHCLLQQNKLTYPIANLGFLCWLARWQGIASASLQITYKTYDNYRKIM